MGAISGRQFRHRRQFADGRQGFRKLADEILEVVVILSISPKILGVEQFEVLGDQRITVQLIPLQIAAIQANDGVDALVGCVVGDDDTGRLLVSVGCVWCVVFSVAPLWRAG
jgi:hypothetical protein